MRARTWITSLVLAALAVLAPGLVVQSQDACDLLVVDEAGVLGSGAQSVTSAAQELVRAGADVRVRAIKTYGAAGNLDRYKSQVEAGCVSWQAADGSIKNNLVVLIIAVDDRATGLYYGAQWSAALDRDWPRISADVMNPRFRDGDFVQGFVNGIGEIRRSVEGRGAPGAAPQSGLWRVLAAVLVVAAVVTGGLVAFRLVAAGRKEKEKRRAAQQKARLAKQGAASRIVELPEKAQMLEIRVGALKDLTSEEDHRPLVSDLEKVKGMTDSAAAAYADLAHSAGDPDREGLAAAEYQAMEEAYQQVLAKLREAELLTGALGERCAALLQIASDMPARFSEVEDALGLAENAVRVARDQGLKTGGPEGLLAEARSTLGRARALNGDRRLSAALEAAKQAAGIASRATASADGLPQRKVESETGASTLTARVDTVQNLIIEGSEVFEGIARSYAEPSWQSVQGNGTEATNRVNWCLQSLEDIAKCLSPERQEWETALDLLGEANAWLDQAELLIGSIKTLETNLAVAKRDGPAEVELAQADITRAWQYINTYDEDIRESLEDDLRQAEKELEIARRELAAGMPDYLVALGSAKAANAAADKILEQARGEHEAAERLRAKLAASLRDARIAVSRAQQYVQDHRSDVSSGATAHLEKAQSYLAEAEASTDLAGRVGAAEKALASAEEAYAGASRDVSAAQDQRQSRYGGAGRRGGIPVPFPMPGHSPGWGRPSPRPPGPGRWGGGGGSTGWGVGRRGGGSTRW